MLSFFEIFTMSGYIPTETKGPRAIDWPSKTSKHEWLRRHRPRAQAERPE